MYDVVTELTCKMNKMSSDSKCKQSSYVTDPSISSCDDSVMFSARSSTENINEVMELSEEMSPQSKLECLKQTLKQRMKQMQAQDDTINDLECQLRKAKKDLTCLKESYDERNSSRQFLVRSLIFSECLLTVERTIRDLLSYFYPPYKTLFLELGGGVYIAVRNNLFILN